MREQIVEKDSIHQTFVERLAQIIGSSANAKYIYGEPLEADGVTVLPVAKASYAFGGGGGKNDEEEGSGGGGGVTVTPVGYIEIVSGEAHFRPTRDWLTLLPVIALAAPSILLSAWALKNLFMRDKKR